MTDKPTIVRIHHGDPDSYARAYNSGWDDALRDAIRDIPEGVNDGWSRYDTDNTHVLTIYAEGQTWDVIAPKENIDQKACPSCGQTRGHHVSCAKEFFQLQEQDR